MTVVIEPVATTAAYAVGATPQQDFPIPFPFDAAGDVLVSVAGVPVSWTLLGGTEDGGIWVGAQARLAAPVANTSVAVVRACLLRQEAVYPLSGSFRTSVLNRETSRLWMALQDQKTRSGNAIARPDSEAANPALTVPPMPGRANRLFGFDAQGLPTTYPVLDRTADTVLAQGSTLARSLGARFADFLSVKDFGAVGDGATDDTTAINAALATGKRLFLPPGTYQVSQLSINVQGTALFGAGPFQSVLRNTTAGQATIVVGPNVHNTVLQDFRLTRTPTAISTGHGVSFPHIHSQAVLENLVSDNNWHGFRLGGTDYSTVTNCIAEANFGAGFFMFNFTTIPAQWYLSNCLAQKNNGCGYEVRAQAGGGATQTTVGDWAGLQTFANGSYGMGVFGLAGVPVHGVRLRDCYLCADANSGLYLDTFGGYHCVDGTFAELAGRDPTGRGMAIAASGLGAGIEATVNNKDLSISGGVMVGHSWSGVMTAAQTTIVNGTRLDDNGRSLVAGNRAGVAQTASAAQVMITGCAMSAAGGTAQINGVTGIDGRYVAIVGCNFTGLASLVSHVFSTFDASATVVGCLPFQFPVLLPGGVAVGVPTGGAAAMGSLNVGGNLLKNNAGYTHP